MVSWLSSPTGAQQLWAWLTLSHKRQWICVLAHGNSARTVADEVSILNKVDSGNENILTSSMGISVCVYIRAVSTA